MSLESILTLAIAVGALAIKPGPGMMMAMSRTLSQGMAGCFAFIAAVNIVSLLYLGLVLTGLRIAEDDLLFVSILIKSLAAVYLIWMGVKGLQNTNIEVKIKEHKAESIFDTFTSCVMLTLSNPLVILFYAGILPTVLEVPITGFENIVIIASVIVAVETIVAVLYCAPLAYSRSFFNENIFQKVNIFASIVIILVGLYIGYSAIGADDLKSILQ